MSKCKITLLFLIFLMTGSCRTPDPESAGPLSGPSLRWHDDKFSMFIHWGLYSEPGGVWNGEPVTRGYSEQIQAHAGIYSDLYAQVADRFNPHNWDPAAIAQLALDAGMRSVVITSKHHDGFCMFESEYTGYNIVRATPYGRDVVGELAGACRERGLSFGLYFSLIDWHYPPACPISSHNADFIPDRHHRYNMNQVRELLTNYGPISELWFDMGSLEPEQSRELKELVHSLQPDCMVSGRLGNDMGDFTVMGDNEYPDYTLDTPWQTPASMFDETWGYRSWQQRGDPQEKIREKLESLIKVVSRGGNYLLNIGPRGDGSVVGFEKEVLLGMGEWLRVNGAAIYGTRPAGFHHAPVWGEITAKENRLFLHILEAPESGTIRLEGISGTPSGSYMLDDLSINPEYNLSEKGIEIILPPGEDFSAIRVVVLQFEEGYFIIPDRVIMLPPFGETKVLDRHNSHKHYSFSGVDYYSTFRSTVRESWTADQSITGSYMPLLYYSAGERSRTIELGGPLYHQIVELKGGEAVNIREDFGGLEFGRRYISGPHISRIDRKTGMEGSVDTSEPWPAERGQLWTEAGEAGSGMIERPVRRNHCWYLWQEIRSDQESELLVKVSRTDGVQVFLNGEEIFVHNNPQKSDLVEDILLLPLREGSNELLVKFYNRFGRMMPFSVDHDIPQTMYRLQLDPVEFDGSRGQGLEWRMHNPLSVHSNMAMPNLRLELQKISQ